MSVSTKKLSSPAVFNLPNQLTGARFILSVVLFAFVTYEFYLTSLILFVIAASTDFLDGYFARKWGMVTALGRVFDPFVDKIIICGTFILLLGVPQSLLLSEMLRPWMVVVVVGREMLVTVLRSFLEGEGVDFSASMSGKLKMIVQCGTAVACLYYLYVAAQMAPQGVTPWLSNVVLASIWATIAITIYSGAGYVRKAFGLMVA